MIVFPNCKINLGLEILHKRPDGFHELESVFFPLPLYDGLETIPSAGSKTPNFSSSGIRIDMAAGDNIVNKAWELLKKDFPGLPAVSIHLHKNIPVGAGLGGGSANGAFALLALNNKFSLGLSQEQLIAYAAILGSDCPFFIVNQPCLVKGRGELLQPFQLDLSAYSFRIVNPGIHINTGWAFSRIHPSGKPGTLADVIKKPVKEWKDRLVNDFEPPIFQEFPAIRSIRDRLYQDGALYAAMTGTGSTVYGIFNKYDRPLNSFPSGYFVKTIE